MKHDDSGTFVPSHIYLSDVARAVDGNPNLTATRKRDLQSAVRRVAKLRGQDTAAVRLDLAEISAQLARVEAAAHGLSAKRLSNIRSDFLAAIKAAGFATMNRARRATLSDAWNALLAAAPSRRVRIGLSRLASYASAEGVEPKDVDDVLMERFMAFVVRNTLHRDPGKLHRRTVAIWNALSDQGAFELRLLQPPASTKKPGRVLLNAMPPSFCADMDGYLRWCRGTDEFDPDARVRPLALRTVKLVGEQIHTAVTALIASGTAAEAVTSLAALVSPEAFKSLMRHRLAATGLNNATAYNRDLAEALVRIADEWVKPDPAVLAELKRVLSKIKVPASGMTDKNNALLREFDDPDALEALIDLPDRLWREVRRDKRWNFRTLALAQAAVGIDIELNIPLRLQNLTDLEFGKHLFLHNNTRAVSSLEVPGEEVKNGKPLEFEVPAALAKRLIEYRDRIAAKIVGHRPARLFVNPDGSPKCAEAVSGLVSRTIKRRLGIAMTVHQFRHLSAKIMLDAEPGAFELVKQVLGHETQKHTVRSYTGINGRRAIRHHQRLIDNKRSRIQPKRRRRPKKVDPGEGSES